MIIPAPNDIAFNLFGIAVYWYGIIMACAIFISIIAANKLANLLNIASKKDIIIAYAPIIIILGILGARLYFCMLNPHYYFAHPLEILDIREGGLSVHGSILAGLLCIYLMSRHYKVTFLHIADVFGCATILGQAIGRWGNYFNSEAYGLPVKSQSWGLFIPEGKRISEYSDFSLFHPTFLYESILDLIAFFILFFIIRKFGKKYIGLTFFSYFILYSIIRFFVEQLRIDSALNINSLPIAIWVSFFFFISGIIGITVILVRNNKRV
jgi:phosphatidylglycerol:prolipoprotein diacylglycerol transferase